jgi:hypothetical protein
VKAILPGFDREIAALRKGRWGRFQKWPVCPEVRSMHLEVQTVRTGRRLVCPEVRRMRPEVQPARTWKRLVCPEVRSMRLEVQTARTWQRLIRPEVRRIDPGVRSVRLGVRRARTAVGPVRTWLRSLRPKLRRVRTSGRVPRLGVRRVPNGIRTFRGGGRTFHRPVRAFRTSGQTVPKTGQFHSRLGRSVRLKVGLQGQTGRLIRNPVVQLRSIPTSGVITPGASAGSSSQSRRTAPVNSNHAGATSRHATFTTVAIPSYSSGQFQQPALFGKGEPVYYVAIPSYSSGQFQRPLWGKWQALNGFGRNPVVQLRSIPT